MAGPSGWAAALGAALTQGTATYRQRTLEDKELASRAEMERLQREQAARSQEAHVTNQRQADLQIAIAGNNLKRQPIQDAREDAEAHLKLQGPELSYTDPNFAATASRGGINLRTGPDGKTLLPPEITAAMEARAQETAGRAAQLDYTKAQTAKLGETNYDFQSTTDPLTGANTMWRLNPKTGQVAQVGGQAGVPLNADGSDTASGDEFLKALDAKTARAVKMMADYEMVLPSGAALRSPYWANLFNMAKQYDPTFNAQQYPARASLRREFSSGKAAINVRSLNTVIGHINTLADKVKALDNGSFTPMNTMKNWLTQKQGDRRIVGFHAAANAVEGELATLFKGTGATDQEIKAWREQLNASQSPEQLEEAMHTVLELAGSRMHALQSQWEIGMGSPLGFKLLAPESERILAKLGSAPAAPEAAAPVSNIKSITIIPD